jgi:pilus assembly protein Flp/PilA
MTKIASIVRAFAREEDGVALTEYLILLGLLVGGVIVAVGVAGGSLSTAWGSWSNFFNNSVSCTSDNAAGVTC